MYVPSPLSYAVMCWLYAPASRAASHAAPVLAPPSSANVARVQTLSVFLSCVLSKKYPHPSSDVIAVLAGLDYVDTICTEFVGTLDGIIRNGETCKEPLP